MANSYSYSFERYKKLGLRDSLGIPFRYPLACKEISVILRLSFDKLPKILQSLLFDDTLFAFSLLPQMQTQSAVSAANLLLQSAESVFPKQKRALVAKKFKQAKIASKRHGKIVHDSIDPVHLPQDVLVHLFCFLDVQSLLTAGLVCRSWNAAANDNYLWQFQHSTHFDGSESILADGKTVVNEQHELSSDGCTSVNQSSKDNFIKAYLGLPYKHDRGLCLYCKSIVWLKNLKCPNQSLGERANEHQLKPLSSDQIGKYIADELHFSWLRDSEDDSDSDDYTESDEELYSVPSSGIWERWQVY